MKKIILINILLFFFLYIILEILTGSLIYKNKLDCHYLHCNRTYVWKNAFTDNDKVIQKIDKYGFRGLRKNIDKIDLLAVGGSTTNQQFINLEDTWPELLEKKFEEIGKNIDVVNAGKGGQSTIGHIWNFDNWFGKIENFRTRYIIFYVGINDVRENIYKNISAYDHGGKKAKNILDKLITILKDNNGITYKLNKFFYNKLFLKNIEIVTYEEKNVDDYKKIKKKFKLTKEHERYLYTNLQELVRLTNKIRATPIFVTQKSLRGNLIDSSIVSFDDKFDYYSAESEIAKIIINLCKKNNIFCIDLHNAIKFEYDDFYDLVHTTKKGTKKIAELIFLEMNNHDLP